MDNEKKYDLIESYLAGKLSGEKLRKFEDQLENDSELKGELELHQQVSETLKGGKVHDLRNVLKDIDKGWKNKPLEKNAKSFSINYFRASAIAAAFLLLIIAYQFFFPSGNQNLDPDYFEVYPMRLTERSNDGNQMLQDAILAYQSQDYLNAHKLFQALTNQNQNNPAYPFYAANAALAVGDNNQAITLLNQLIQKENHPFLEMSRWYLAITLLQNEDKATAKEQLSLISKGQYKYADAQKILKQLE